MNIMAIDKKYTTQKERIERILSKISSGERFDDLSGLTIADFLSIVQELVSSHIQMDNLEREIAIEKNKVLQLKLDRDDIQDSMSELFETQRISEAIQSSRDPESVLIVLITFLKDILKPEAYGFYVNDAKMFDSKSIKKFFPKSLGSTIDTLKDDGVLDWALSEANPIVIPAVNKSNIDGEFSLVIIPLVTANERPGILILNMNKPPDFFNANELRILSILANHTAIAIENIWLNKETERTKIFLENLIESSPLPIFATSLDNKIMFFNPSAGELLGLSNEDLQGKNIATIMEGGDKALTKIKGRIKKEGRVVGANVNLLNMNGETIPVSLTTSEFISDRDNSKDYLWLCESLQEKVALEEERIKSENLRVLYNTVIALNHELNNPLTVMNGNLKLLGSMLSDKDKNIGNLLESALGAGKRIEEVTKKLANIKEVEYSQYNEKTEMLKLE